MPTLRSYKPSSSKTGYYIQANVGASHPITLQVTPIAEQILRKTGYEQDQSVPTKLVWAMYDLELLYTKKSLEPSTVDDVSTEDILQNLGLESKLSPSEREEVISYIKEYEGPQKETLTQLKRDLEVESGSGSEKDPTGPGGVEDSADLPEDESEAVAYLYQMVSGVAKFREAKNMVDEDYLLRSLRTFLPHNYVNIHDSYINDDFRLCYNITRGDHDKTFWMTDQRGPGMSSVDPSVEYTVRISSNDGEAEATIVDGEIDEFTPANEGGYSAHDLEDDLDWILPTVPVEMDEIVGPTYTEYGGQDLRPIQGSREGKDPDLRIVEVDRISDNGNPVVEIGESQGANEILDFGNPGQEYLVECNRKRWRTLSEVID